MGCDQQPDAKGRADGPEKSSFLALSSENGLRLCPWLSILFRSGLDRTNKVLRGLLLANRCERLTELKRHVEA